MVRLILLALSATVLLAVSAPGGRTGSTAARCGKWAVPARIAGKAVCLRDNRACQARRAAQYRRHGFDCIYGTLLTRWSYLRQRPLVQQLIEPVTPCPVTTKTGQVGSYPGLGPGPAYPIGSSSVITIRMPPPEGWGDEWSGTKRLWLLDNRYVARALVRGHQLDGPNEVRFAKPAFIPHRLNPIPELQLDQLRDYPSLTRLRAPGCYAYQVDGRTFSYFIVFEARLEEATGP
jgi:hypothetical protein